MIFYFFIGSLKSREAKKRSWRFHSPQLQHLPQCSPVLPSSRCWWRWSKTRLRRSSPIANAYLKKVISNFFVWWTPSGRSPKVLLYISEQQRELKRFSTYHSCDFLLFGVLFMSTSAPLLFTFQTVCPYIDLNLNHVTATLFASSEMNGLLFAPQYYSGRFKVYIGVTGVIQTSFPADAGCKFRSKKLLHESAKLSGVISSKNATKAHCRRSVIMIVFRKQDAETWPDLRENR